ncbi:long-chain fatty acid--CoA ligase [Halorientalis sp. IM1011]|uniref:AMP-dependent synthetase/ligase n=1 Tax=Halorientalis sp. IM1011 TaxID=1932360 RepID=UPI00097CC5A1|nr:long-chain fatty acid--CoA ligase [Halorientalis sp. IM1011]AQL42609.1 long-chain fatty acid--CoA ligase [Halorientalis sp. IM1011]
MTGAGDQGWLEAEREYTDEVIGEDTLPELFEASVERHGDGEAQLYKGGIYPRSLTPEVVDAPEPGEYASITYEKMGEIVRRLAAGFREMGVSSGDRVGIMSDSRMEWALSDFGLLSAGGVVTTIYTESSPKQIKYLLNDPEATGVVVENEYLLDRLVRVQDDLSLEFVVVIDELDKYDHVDQIHTLKDVYDRGTVEYDEAAYEAWLDELDPYDLASLVYTSGTTGKPKGVKLTHHNVRSNVNQLWKRVGPRPDKDDDLPVLDSDKRAISILPLAHVFERTVGHFLMFAAGATVGYAQSTDTVDEDITKIEPHGGASVPRVYERIFAQAREQASGSDFKERVFEWAIDVARQYSRADDPGFGLRAKRGIAERLVYSKVKEELGGNVILMVSGGGSLSDRLAELFDGMGIPIFEGYGLTEAAPVVTANPPEDHRTGTLGPPLPGVDIRIDPSKVSDEQFADAEGFVGELLVKGPNVTEGYWEMPEETDDAFTNDGWFKTGDIVERTDDDYLIYHDRLKNLLVLDTGKNVAPEPIEDEFSTSSRVEQIMVMGDDEKFVSALIVPNFDAIRRWASNRNIDLPTGRNAICEDDRVREWVVEDVNLVNRNLEKHETIKEIELVPEEWTPENDMLTPSLKKKRRNILDEHAGKVERIYGDREKATAD